MLCQSKRLVCLSAGGSFYRLFFPVLEKHPYQPVKQHDWFFPPFLIQLLETIQCFQQLVCHHELIVTVLLHQQRNRRNAQILSNLLYRSQRRIGLPFLNVLHVRLADSCFFCKFFYRRSVQFSKRFHFSIEYFVHVHWPFLLYFTV